jgi:hypothetical protein
MTHGMISWFTLLIQTFRWIDINHLNQTGGFHMHNSLRSPYNRPPRAQRGSSVIALLILDLCTRRGWVVSTTPRPLYPGKDPLYRRLDGPQGRTEHVRKISPPPGFFFLYHSWPFWPFLTFYLYKWLTWDWLFYFPFRRKACCEFSQPEKSDGFGRERTRDLGYQRSARKPLDHRSRLGSIPGPSD